MAISVITYTMSAKVGRKRLNKTRAPHAKSEASMKYTTKPFKAGICPVKSTKRNCSTTKVNGFSINSFCSSGGAASIL